MTTTGSARTSSEMVRAATSAPLRLAARNLELFDTGDVAGVDEVFAADLIDHTPVDGARSAIDGMRLLVAAVRDGFTDTQHRVLFLQELSDGWVVVHWRMTATHTGDAFGFTASGNRVDINGTDIVRVVGDKITEIYHVEQLLRLSQQITGRT